MTTTPLPTSPPKRALPYRRLAALLLLLLVAVAVVLYIKTLPGRREQALRTASLADLQAQVAREPDNTRAFYYLGLRLRAAGRDQDAANALQKAAELAPDDEEVWLEWARIAHKSLGATAAYKILDHFVSSHPKSARGQAALASLYSLSAYWTSALDAATKATALNAQDLESWQILGMAGLKVQDYGRAEAGFQHSVALAPEDWHGYIGLSEVYGAQGRSADAVQQCREAVRRAPTEPEPHLQLGKLLLRTAASNAEVEAARNELVTPLRQKATMTPEQEFFLGFYLGQSYARQSDWSQARLWLERVATVAPNDPTVQHELATVYRRLGDQARFAATVKREKEINAYLSEAKALSDRIAATPTDLEARLKLARLHAAHGDLSAAMKDYGLLLVRDPNRADARREYDALRQRYGGGAP